MKTIGLGAAALVLLTATAWLVPGTASADEDTSGQMAAASQESNRPDPAQIGRGAKAWADTCNRCHNLRGPKEFTDKDWDVIVSHMGVIAPLPGQEVRDIKAFLKASN